MLSLSVCFSAAAALYAVVASCVDDRYRTQLLSGSIVRATGSLFLVLHGVSVSPVSGAQLQLFSPILFSVLVVLTALAARFGFARTRANSVALASWVAIAHMTALLALEVSGVAGTPHWMSLTIAGPLASVSLGAAAWWGSIRARTGSWRPRTTPGLTSRDALVVRVATTATVVMAASVAIGAVAVVWYAVEHRAVVDEALGSPLALSRSLLFLMWAGPTLLANLVLGSLGDVSQWQVSLLTSIRGSFGSSGGAIPALTPGSSSVLDPFGPRLLAACFLCLVLMVALRGSDAAKGRDCVRLAVRRGTMCSLMFTGLVWAARSSVALDPSTGASLHTNWGAGLAVAAVAGCLVALCVLVAQLRWARNAHGAAVSGRWRVSAGVTGAACAACVAIALTAPGNEGLRPTQTESAALASVAAGQSEASLRGAPQQAGPPQPAVEVKLSSETTRRVRAGIDRLRQPSRGRLSISTNAMTGAASFVSGRTPVNHPSASLIQQGRAVLQDYSDALGVSDILAKIEVVRSSSDELGMRHIYFRQVLRGVPVTGGGASVHLDRDGEQVTAVSSSLYPDISLHSVKPSLTPAAASAAAAAELPGSVAIDPPSLVVSPRPAPNGRRGYVATLDWAVGRTRQTVNQTILVNAHTGQIDGTVSLTDTIAGTPNRFVYDAAEGSNEQQYGGLARSGTMGPVADHDVNEAFVNTGRAYDYYWNNFGRDSVDGHGLPLISNVHYGGGMQNAFWNGGSHQMDYGTGFTALDVTVHELTHGVTQFTANFGCCDQPGALNEAFSDIAATNVDGNWSIGESLPVGAIRDLANPASHQETPGTPDPSNFHQYQQACSNLGQQTDYGRIHANSTIWGHGYYQVVSTIGRAKAQRIYYRAQVVYLNQGSGFEDARNAVLQSAQDIGYASDYGAIANALASVGIDGSYDPGRMFCADGPPPLGNPGGGCLTSVTVDAANNSSLVAAAGGAQTLTDLAYAVRDDVLAGSGAGQYLTATYYADTGQISELLLGDAQLRHEAGTLLTDMAPSLTTLAASGDDPGAQTTVLTPAVAAEFDAFLEHIKTADEAVGDDAGALTDRLNELQDKVGRVSDYAGLSYGDALQAFEARLQQTG